MFKSPSFDVLDRNLNVHAHHLLEASAGTGKTFSIENTVVRLLIENSEPWTLDKLLVMTFTRAAARDLKQRIHRTIQNAYTQLERRQSSLDYLVHILEQGPTAVDKAKAHLETALFNFDQAQIFTIHGFCNRMLRTFVFEGGLSLDLSGGENSLPKELYKKGIHDFLCTGVTTEKYGKTQIIRLVEKHYHDQAKLEKELLPILLKRGRVVPPDNFKTLYTRFLKGMEILKTYHPQKILEDYTHLVPLLKKISQKPAASYAETVHSFASLLELSTWTEEHFEQFIQDGPALIAIFDPEQRNKNKKLGVLNLHYPDFYRQLQTALAPALEAGNVHLIAMRLAADCQTHMRKILKEEECLGPDELLAAMLDAVKQPLFCACVRAAYGAVIVDEFQDTDPLQWEIFQTLFLNPTFQGHLTLVGDPKQSIYAFRQADIYTYLAAAKALGPDAKGTLDTNYRSQASLVQALNGLFSAAKDFMPLPRMEEILPYRLVKAGSKIDTRTFNDAWGPLHFMCANTGKKNDLEKSYIAFIASEIQGLLSLDGVSPREIAILVKDRHQAENALQALRTHGIPVQQQRQAPLSESAAIDLLSELLQAVLQPRRESFLKIALGGPLIGWDHIQIQNLAQANVLEKVLVQFYILHQVLHEKGFAPFFQSFLKTSFDQKEFSVQERLLTRTGGLELYQDLLQLAEILICVQSDTRLNPVGLLQYLEEFKSSSVDEETAVKRRIDTDQDAVQILTIHSSKGLEFEIVFALGLFVPSKEPEWLVPDEKGELFTPITHEDDPLYIAYCREQTAEKMRQLYVAMTRAKLRLYVPIAKSENGKYTESPIDCFIQKLDRPLESFASELITFSEVTSPSTSAHLALQSNLELQQPPQLELSFERQLMLSYSALAKGAHRPLKELPQLPPHDFSNEIKTVHTLPAGSEIGNLLHTLLEVVSFNKPDELPLLDPLICHTPFEMWKTVLEKLIHVSLTTPLPLKTGLTALSSISKEKIYREMDFMYPWNEELILPETERVPGYLKGVIDLIFEHEGYYYLADWKSNWLGPDRTYYTQSHLNHAMEDNGYLLQAHVYKETLRRYLALFDSRPFETLFGGMFYLFLRGLDPHQNDGTGIYYFSPERTPFHGN